MPTSPLAAAPHGDASARDASTWDASTWDARHRELWERTAAVAGRLNRAQAELVEIIGEVMAGRHWGEGGFTSPEHYLVVRAGLSSAHAADVVRVAKRRGELTDAAAALDAGALSLDQVAVLARHVPASHQASVTEFARNATVPQLRRAVPRHAFPTIAPVAFDGADDPRTQVERDHDAARASAAEERACASRT